MPCACFLFMILLSTGLAPLLGGYLVAWFGWRAVHLHRVRAVSRSACSRSSPLPSLGRVHPEQRGDAHFWPYICCAFAQGALLIVMQQVRLELFSTSPELIVLTQAGLVVLAWFVAPASSEAVVTPSCAAREDLSRGHRAVYRILFTNNAMSYLVSRFLEGGLHYPVENAGRLTGFTSPASLLMAFVYFRFSSRITHKKWLIVPCLLIAAFVGAWVMHMPPDVSMPWLIAPLVLRGLLLLFIALPVANVTFRIFAIEEFNHSYRFKNIVKQLTYSFATLTIIILQQHRLAVHQTRLAESVNPFNPVFQDSFERLMHGFESLGYGAAQAKSLALVEVDRIVRFSKQTFSARWMASTS